MERRLTNLDKQEITKKDIVPILIPIIKKSFS